MEFDAFTGGINPGGLRNKNEIRILICYLLSSIDSPLSKEDIINIMQENALANYFEVTDALSELIEHNNITVDTITGLCTPEDSARMIAEQLDTALPASVRECAVSAAINLLARARLERENKVEISKTDHGYYVTCHISGGSTELMSFKLYVPDLRQAKLVKKNFYQSPGQLYQVLLSLITKNKDLATDMLRQIIVPDTKP